MGDQGAPPEGYTRCIEAMQGAGAAWFRAHPFAEPRFRTHAFEEEMAREAGRPGEKPAIVAPLGAVIDRWADNEDARALLREMERAGAGDATYLQAKAIIEHAQERAIERAQGQLPTGDWRCTGCQRISDAFTNADGKPEVPGPGSLSVCWYCAALQCVNATSTGYAPLSTRDVNQLPKSVRKQLLSLRNMIQQRLEKEGARS